jgi:hypothetical protein
VHGARPELLPLIFAGVPGQRIAELRIIRATAGNRTTDLDLRTNACFQ